MKEGGGRGGGHVLYPNLKELTQAGYRVKCANSSEDYLEAVK